MAQCLQILVSLQNLDITYQLIQDLISLSFVNFFYHLTLYKLFFLLFEKAKHLFFAPICFVFFSDLPLTLKDSTLSLLFVSRFLNLICFNAIQFQRCQSLIFRFYRTTFSAFFAFQSFQSSKLSLEQESFSKITQFT